MDKVLMEKKLDNEAIKMRELARRISSCGSISLEEISSAMMLLLIHSRQDADGTDSMTGDEGQRIFDWASNLLLECSLLGLLLSGRLAAYFEEGGEIKFKITEKGRMDSNP